MNIGKNKINGKSISSKSIFVVWFLGLSILALGLWLPTVQAGHDSITKNLDLGINEISFRDIDNTGPQTSSLDVDSSTVKAGFITVTVTDSEADIDLNGIDSVTAFGNVTTVSGSSKTVVPILLLETGTSTQTFVGEAKIVVGNTASGNNEIPILTGETLEIDYTPELETVGRFFASLDVSVAGSVELSDLLITNAAQVDCAFTLVTQPVRLEFSDATVDDITVTMSYANGATPSAGVTPTSYHMLYAPFVPGPVTFQFVTLTGNLLLPNFFGTTVDLSGHSDFANTLAEFIPKIGNNQVRITNLLQPQNADGLYAIGYVDNACPGGGGGGLVRPGLVVNVLAGAGAVSALFGGGSGGGAAPTFGDASILVFENQSEAGFGGTILEADETSLETTQTVKTGDTVVLRFNLYENQGINNLERAKIFFNFEGDQYDSSAIDTHITYKRGSALSIVDPHEKFETAEIEILQQDAWNIIVKATIVFKNPFNTSILVEAWDYDRYSGKKLFPDALQVEPSILLADEIKNFDTTTISLDTTETVITELTEVPIWIKNNALWWEQKQIDDADFMAGIEYLIQKAIIKIDEDQISDSDYSQDMPNWIRDIAGYWANDSITDDEFVKAVQWLIENGVLKVQS